MMLEWLCIPLETGLWYSRNIKSDLKRMNPGYITLFLSTGVPPPFARWWKSASNHNGSDSYVKYLFSCHIGSVDKNNFIYCHGGGIKIWKFEKKSWESTGNYLICFQFKFYLKIFKRKKVRVILRKLQKKVFSATFRRCETPFFNQYRTRRSYL